MAVSHVRYEIRFAEPFANWEADSDGRTSRMLTELGRAAHDALAWMAAGYPWRGNFADYRICAADLDVAAQQRQSEIDSKEANQR